MSSTLLFRIVLVAVAGAIGALARWGTSVASQALLGRAWPVGTLVVNVVGCFVFGWVFEELRHDPSPSHDVRRLFWLTGFCGAYTTFSTFAFDLVELQASRGLGLAALNMALHLGLGLVAIVAGLAVGRLW
jgi:CrcB protein